jgi:hypothetical protein
VAKLWYCNLYVVENQFSKSLTCPIRAGYFLSLLLTIKKAQKNSIVSPELFLSSILKLFFHSPDYFIGAFIGSCIL